MDLEYQPFYRLLLSTAEPLRRGRREDGSWNAPAIRYGSFAEAARRVWGFIDLGLGVRGEGLEFSEQGFGFRTAGLMGLIKRMEEVKTSNAVSGGVRA